MSIKFKIYKVTKHQKHMVAKEARMKQVLSKPGINIHARPYKRRHNHSPIKLLPPERYPEENVRKIRII